MNLLVGTLTDLGGPGLALVSLEGDRMKILRTDDRLYNPSWQGLSPDGRIFTTHSNGKNAEPGQVSELRITKDGMEILSTRDVFGAGPCHLAFSDDGRYLLCANYHSGSLSVFPLFKDGIGEMVCQIRHEGAGPHPTRQTKAHIHQVTRIPNLPDCFSVVDLGCDRISVYQLTEEGQLSLRYDVPAPAGQGPRHVAYRKNGEAYLVTELGNRIYPLSFGENAGVIREPGVSTVKDASVPNTAAALWVSPDDRVLYVSNRGEGTLKGFSLPDLRLVYEYTLFGEKPRDFCLIDDSLIVTACQDAGLTLLRDGRIIDTLPCPGAIRVLRLPE